MLLLASQSQPETAQTHGPYDAYYTEELKKTAGFILIGLHCVISGSQNAAFRKFAVLDLDICSYKVTT